MSEESKAEKYAEKRLGVHSVYMDLLAAQAKYEDAMRRHAEYQAHVRCVREELDNHEIVLTMEHRAMYPDMSVAAFDRHMKGILQADPDCQAKRMEIIENQNMADYTEVEVRGRRSEVEGHIARLHELSGLLNFYAATKTSAT